MRDSISSELFHSKLEKALVIERPDFIPFSNSLVSYTRATNYSKFNFSTSFTSTSKCGLPIFDLIHSKFPELISKIASEKKINQLVHLSSLGIDKVENSIYALSKKKGENKKKKRESLVLS